MGILIIETSTERGVIAYVDQGKIIQAKELPIGLNQSTTLWPALQTLSQAVSLSPECLDYIGVGIGPGSYTGIRIGVVIAKGLAYAWKLPLIGVPSLKAFVPEQEGEFAALIDAKIAGVYVIKGIKRNGEVLYLSEPAVCKLEELKDYLGGITSLITPFSKTLQGKIHKLYPQSSWQLEEQEINIPHFVQLVQAQYAQQEWDQSGRLRLLYLRPTQAEIERGS